MAKASRVAARTQKTLLSLEERVERIELMLEVMMTKKQQADFEALLNAPDEDESDEPVELSAIEQQVNAIHEAMPVMAGEAEHVGPEEA